MVTWSWYTRRMLVYVLDDSRTQLQALVTMLEDAGHQAHGFASLAAIQDALAQVTPDAIVADLHLRGPDPWGTCLPLLGCGAPVIVVTMDFDEAAARAMLEAGAVAVVDKRDPEGILAAVSASLDAG